MMVNIGAKTDGDLENTLFTSDMNTAGTVEWSSENADDCEVFVKNA